MLKCFAEGTADIEVHLGAKDGRRTPFYVTGFRLDVEGRPCMLGVGIDITPRNGRAEALARPMHRLRRQNSALAEQAQDPDFSACYPEDALRMITGNWPPRRWKTARQRVVLTTTSRTRFAAPIFTKGRGTHSRGHGD